MTRNYGLVVVLWQCYVRHIIAAHHHGLTAGPVACSRTEQHRRRQTVVWHTVDKEQLAAVGVCGLGDVERFWPPHTTTFQADLHSHKMEP
jgi:hypothetical protein